MVDIRIVPKQFPKNKNRKNFKVNKKYLKKLVDLYNAK